MNGNLSRHLKRVIVGAIVLTLVAGAAPMQSLAELTDMSITASAEVITGSYGSISWSYDDEKKELTFSGKGAINFSDYVPDLNKTSLAEKIIVEEGITGIKYMRYRYAKSITLPNTVTTISDEAFGSGASACYALESITLPDSVTALGENAFYGCTGLKTVHLSNNITSLRRGTFYNCKNLETIYLPANLKSIESKYMTSQKSVFGGCTSLKSIKIPGTVEEIGSSAFQDCTALETVEIGNGVKKIWGSVFAGCTSLNTISIPESVETIYYSAFNGCTSLETVTLNEGLKEIGYYAFKDCTSLKSITIPDSVETINGNTFENCTSLKTAVISNSVDTIPNQMFLGCEALESMVIPSGIKTISYEAFNGCQSLETAVIPDSVTQISSGAFEDCSGMTSVTLSKGLTMIESNVFKGCSSLTSIEIPSGVTSIGSVEYSDSSGPFVDCTSLSTIKFSDTVTEIGTGSFMGCTSLETLTIPDTVTSLGNSAFKDCTNLSSVTLSKNVESLPMGLFENCTSLKSIDIPEGVTTISNGDSYDDLGTFKGCTSLTSVNIPDSVTNIGTSAFAGCIALESIDIPENITHIGYNAFGECTGLTSIDLPDNLEVIGPDAFVNCSGLSSVEIPESVNEIYEEAFLGCTNLKSVTFKGDNGIFFGLNAFGSLTENESIEFPKKSKGGMNTTECDYIYPDSEEHEGRYYSCNLYFGNAKVAFKNDNVTYQHVEAVQPTCTEDGRYEYYLGSDGNYYIDAYGFEMYESYEDTTWEALGHDEKISWSWIKIGDSDYKAVAKFSCSRGDLDTTAVTAEVSVDWEDDSQITYKAVAICPLKDEMPSWHSEEHTNYYVVEKTKYSVNVEGGSVTASTHKDEYYYNDSVTVKADTVKDGKYLKGWYIGDVCVSTNPTYTFFVKEDTTITAKYAEKETSQQAVNSLKLTRIGGEYYYSSQKLKYASSWSLPKGCKLVEAGILRAYDKDISNVTPETAKENGVTRNKSSLKTANGSYTLTVNMKWETKSKTVYAKGYIIYTDAKNVRHTQMTDMQISSYEN